MGPGHGTQMAGVVQAVCPAAHVGLFRIAGVAGAARPYLAAVDLAAAVATAVGSWRADVVLIAMSDGAWGTPRYLRDVLREAARHGRGGRGTPIFCSVGDPSRNHARQDDSAALGADDLASQPWVHAIAACDANGGWYRVYPGYDCAGATQAWGATYNRFGPAVALAALGEPRRWSERIASDDSSQATAFRGRRPRARRRRLRRARSSRPQLQDRLRRGQSPGGVPRRRRSDLPRAARDAPRARSVRRVAGVRAGAGLAGRGEAGPRKTFRARARLRPPGPAPQSAVPDVDAGAGGPVLAGPPYAGRRRIGAAGIVDGAAPRRAGGSHSSRDRHRLGRARRLRARCGRPARGARGGDAQPRRGGRRRYRLGKNLVPCCYGSRCRTRESSVHRSRERRCRRSSPSAWASPC